MKASQIKPLGNRLLVRVVGPHVEDKKGVIVKPGEFDYPKLEAEVISLSKSIPVDEFVHLILSNIIIHNKAGIVVETEEEGVEYRLITPQDILLILES